MNDDSEEVNWLSSLVEVKEISKWSLDTVWHIQDKFKSYYYMIIYKLLFSFNSFKLGQHKIMCKHKNFMHADMVKCKDKIAKNNYKNE